MKFTTVLAFIAAATVVSASTNAERLARGMPPNKPARRGTPPSRAHKSYPSGKPNKCDNGDVYCCNSVQKGGEGGEVDNLLELLKLKVPAGTSVGMNCSPLTILGAGGTSCTQQTVCCKDNHFNGLINVGCAPININL